MPKTNTTDLTYSEAIEQVMLHNGYYAPLKLIYREVWKYKSKDTIRGKTPDYTIQAIVQREDKFTRIGLGVYALTDFLHELPTEIEPKTKQDATERTHARIQGMLLEIGNQRIEIAETYTNDKKFVFENKMLGNLATLPAIPAFTYENLLKETVRFFDVIWFNHRGFPHTLFEVEDSTNFRDALIKFSEIRDFCAEFYCVADEERRVKFDLEIGKSPFREISNRVKFATYEMVENDYKNLLVTNYF